MNGFVQDGYALKAKDNKDVLRRACEAAGMQLDDEARVIDPDSSLSDRTVAVYLSSLRFHAHACAFCLTVFSRFLLICRDLYCAWSSVARVTDRSEASSSVLALFDSASVGGATVLDRGLLDILAVPAEDKVVVRPPAHFPS